MKNFIRSAALAISLAATSLASAASFNYSYTFTNGVEITGSFLGTANGNLVTDISNVFASVNGKRFYNTGALHAYSYDGTSVWGNEAVASFDGFANNFIFADASSSVGFVNAFLMVPMEGDTQVQVVPYGYLQDKSGDGSIQARWNLEMAAPVPEPETYAMLLAGLGAVGFAARRRQRRIGS